jgi:hypothetical protein
VSVAATINIDVKISICLQRYASLYYVSKEVKIKEEKFIIESHEESKVKLNEIYRDFKSSTYHTISSESKDDDECFYLLSMMADVDESYES